ncbi:rod shape-determining protein RodA [Geothrix limicola]|uniref:Rod shape-determining protein RodA n=1 Tax=Geothrix limicola TaxID=2927978 RepID=A0ABQ5QG26_9BACT|nr:rod shape-determining protein RodA [Geothrix limicola]GLH73533.1 rod shape-determining protein RodA [Geothrix limicola]
MKERFRALDPRLLWVLLALIALGTLTLYSAGRNTVQATIWLKQSVWNLLGLSLMLLLASMDPRRIFRYSFVAYLLGLAALAAVLVVGKKIGGSTRWFSIAGQTFQPSELMKWVTLLYLSQRLGSRNADTVGRLELVGAIGLVVFPMLLIERQPDLGMALSFLPILLIIPLMKGLRARWIVALVLLVLAGGFGAWKFALKPYQKQRVMIFLDPSSDLKKKGYQVNQSKIAIGSGGLIGKGFTSGSQTQLNFLPVKTTDFAFSVWAEERGFLGVLLALGLFGLLMSRILDAARAAHTNPEAYFCAGAAGIFGLHLLVNVGMVAGALPNKGMVLPFFSAGGSSTLSFFLALGLIMGILHRSRVK